MTKKKISKASSKRLALFGTISVFIIGYFVFTLCFYLYNLYKLQNQEEKYASDLIELKREEKLLKTEIEKLQDKDYIARYAREKYLYSKDGEYILKITNTDDEETEERKKINFNIDYNYIIYGGIVVIGLIIFIVVKKKK